MNAQQKYDSFAQFYPFYLSQHANRSNRRLHFCGTLTVLGLVFAALLFSQWLLFWAVPLAGYGFAWWGHFFVEKNKPATFTYPVYSLIGDFVMFGQMLTGKIRF